MTTYEKAIAASDMLDGMDVSDYEVGIARIIRMLSDEKSAKMKRRKAAVEKLTRDVPVLFEIAVEVYIGSAGASTPRDSAENVVSCYMGTGMDVETVRKMARSSQFAYLYANK